MMFENNLSPANSLSTVEETLCLSERGLQNPQSTVKPFLRVFVFTET